MGFDRILTNTLKNEGGVTTDTGGLTNFGITQDTYNAVAPQLGLEKKSVKDLKYGDVRKVYESEYYQKPGIDQIPSEKVQGVLFDWGVNAGTGTAIKKLQKIVGATPDGKMGKKTLAALNNYIEANGEDALAIDLLGERLNHYQQLIQSNPEKYGKYENGWVNRIDAVSKQNL